MYVISLAQRIRATEIQFKAYISYSILKEYLMFLLENDLLEYIDGERTFRTSPKGMQFLCTYNQMGELITLTNTANKEPDSEFLL
jgi:predicted transcriptional regulator